MSNFFNNILNIIYFPLAMLLKLCYMVTGNYGLAILLFALIAKIILFPLAIKGEKNRLKQAKLQPKVNQIQAKYRNDTRNQKYQEEISALYQSENFSPWSGCLPTLIQFPIILGLWNAIRQPLRYICYLGENTRFFLVKFLYDKVPAFADTITTATIKDGLTDIAGKTIEEIKDLISSGSLSSLINNVMTWLRTNEISVATQLSKDGLLDQAKSFLDTVKSAGLAVTSDFELINLDFLGMNIGEKPSDFGIIAWTTIIPIVAGITSFLVSFVSTKINKNPGVDEKTNASMNAMLYTMPLLSVWMAYSFQIGIGFYWIFSNILSIAQIFVLRAVVKQNDDDGKKKKDDSEKKLNYTQVEKMKRLESAENSTDNKKKQNKN